MPFSPAHQIYEVLFLAITIGVLSASNNCPRGNGTSVKHDETMIAGSKGCVLVQSVLEKIGKISFNPDYMFMARAAYASSEFGFAPVKKGGIWAITEKQWDIVGKDGGLLKLKKEINKTLSIDCTGLSYEQTKVPMYSGLAARLYVAILERSNKMPFSSQRKEQAELYAKFTGVKGEQSKFLKKLLKLENEETSQNCIKCEMKSKQMDLMIIMDESGSVSNSQYDKEKKFVASLGDKFNISRNGTRVSIITFSSKANTAYDFNQISSNADLRSKITHLKKVSGGTNCKSAFEVAKKLFEKNRGSRIDDNSVQKVLLFLTDGVCNHGSDAAVKSFQRNKSDVNIFAIGIGNGMSESGLLKIASEPQNVLKLRDGFDALLLMSSSIEQQICSSVMKIKSNSNTTLEIGNSLQQMEFEKVQPDQDFIVLVNASSYGLGTVMEAAWSFVIEKPTSSYNDGFKIISNQPDGMLAISNSCGKPATLHFSLRSTGNGSQPVVVNSGTNTTLAGMIQRWPKRLDTFRSGHVNRSCDCDIVGKEFAFVYQAGCGILSTWMAVISFMLLHIL